MKTSTIVLSLLAAAVVVAVFKLLAYFQDINNPD